ncbi:Hypothetical protein NTJ_09826 [Nesidiocoris tenuis]|uniref:Gustatory receptor n=1 Tax=Nesidiocoris tenuis TaxID=355587 RepID=A0ABN7AYG4_9HEMI|nr:Hypothetical protein NTJ_09826 [Nesidiocoris tenuis]
MHAKSSIAVLWTFKISKYFGVSGLYNSKQSIIAGTVLQIITVISTISWVIWSNSVKQTSMNTITFSVTHIVTTYSAGAITYYGWGLTPKIEQVVIILDRLRSEPEKRSSDVILQSITWAAFFSLIVLDVVFVDSYLDHFENFVYYLPLVQILMVSNQFMTLVKQAELRLHALMKTSHRLKVSNAELVKNYITLYTVCKLINDCYSYQNFIILIQHMLGTTFGLSYFSQAALKMFPATIARKKLLLNSMSTVVFMGFIFLKFKFCQSIQLKAKEFKETLLDRLSSRAEGWSSHLEFNHKDIKFSAFNVYPFDYETLSSIVNMLMTYQIVLLQFALGRQRTREVQKRNNLTSPVRTDVF